MRGYRGADAGRVSAGSLERKNQMIVKPKVRGFICTTAHPAGCRENVRRQIAYVRSKPAIAGAKKALIIGASTGYGLASRIALAFGAGAKTIGVAFEKPASGSRTATAGYYNTESFEHFAKEAGLYAKSFNGDAYSAEMKAAVIDAIQAELGQVDCVVYSLAAPRRTMPDGTAVSSVLKTVGAPYTNKTIDLRTGEVHDITVEAATEEEIANTIKVMGGDDWASWIDALKRADALAPNAVTIAYSYIGPKVTHPMYLDGSIGQAKADLYRTAKEISAKYGDVNAYVSVNKALVTQSSAAIPIVPLYISILYHVMKEKGCHEGCIEQMYRLFAERVYGDLQLDAEGRIRVDDYEMQDDVQAAVMAIWDSIKTENVGDCADLDGFWKDFYQMFGFELDGVDYEADVDIMHVQAIGREERSE